MSCSSAKSIWDGFKPEFLNAFEEAFFTALIVVIVSLAERLEEDAADAHPSILALLEEKEAAFSSDVIMIDVEPSLTGQNSKILNGSAIILELITSSRVTGFWNCA
jgi:hypothetical protein